MAATTARATASATAAPGHRTHDSVGRLTKRCEHRKQSTGSASPAFGAGDRIGQIPMGYPLEARIAVPTSVLKKWHYHSPWIGLGWPDRPSARNVCPASGSPILATRPTTRQRANALILAAWSRPIIRQTVETRREIESNIRDPLSTTLRGL
jgi:hypothetical protein